MINTALLLISLSGTLVYELPVPNMEECLKVRTQIEEQNSYAYSTICIPVKDNSDKVIEWIDRVYPPKCGTSKFEDHENEMRDWEWRKKFLE